MKKIKIILIGFFISMSLNAQESKKQNLDTLDILDKQSKEFFNAITGLEKDYLQDQISAIKDKSKKEINNVTPAQQQVVTKVQEPILSDEDNEINVFKHENKMARLTTDFTRTKKLKDIRIKSMYSFNGRNYVVLKLSNQTTSSVKDEELSSNIEGRYTVGDSILTHKVIAVNRRTKTVELYKKLDDEYGYAIYLSNYGISVSDLEKKELNLVEKKRKEKKEDLLTMNILKNLDIKKLERKLEKKPKKTETNKCTYKVIVENLNVRNSNNIDGKILRILRINDKFTIQEKRNSWVKLHTIYKKISTDKMNVKNENNWVQFADDNVAALNDDCL